MMAESNVLAAFPREAVGKSSKRLEPAGRGANAANVERLVDDRQAEGVEDARGGAVPGPGRWTLDDAHPAR